VEVLLERGAEINAKIGHGRTPTDLAFGLTVLRRGDEILKLL
jgi:hypothetical protein